MAEDNYARTEPASERRLAQARAGGDVPRSPDLSAFMVLLVMMAGLIWWGSALVGSLQAVLASHMAGAARFSLDGLFQHLAPALLPFILFMLAIFAAALIAPLLLSGWVFAPQAMQFQGARIHPLARISRLFSLDGLFDTMKALLIWVIAGSALLWFYRTRLHELAQLTTMSLADALALSLELLLAGLLLLMAAALLSAILDVPWRWWRYLKSHAMTRAELLAEAREAEGRPEFKSRIQVRQQLARAARTERRR